jgi:MoaA/NifB/PqqE/SkfB family radical SAM enzyme
VYALDEIAAEPARFREAFARAQPFRPLYVKVKLLYGCNLRCGMCNHWRVARPAQLPRERLDALLDELAALGCRKVHFTGGEPALRPDLEEIVAHAAAAGIRPTLTTNGTLFTRARARRIVEAGLRGVNVSVDSPVPEVHDRVRGVDGAFAATLEGLKNLGKESRRGKLAIALNTVVTRLNWASLEGLPRLAVRVGARTLRLMAVDDHTGQALRPSPPEIAEYNARVAPRLLARGRAAGLLREEAEAYPFGRTPDEVARGARGDYALGYYQARPCYAPATHALVDHEGRVFVCCMARGEPLLGSVRAAPFADAWHGVAFSRVRADMRDGRRLPPCARCDDFVDVNRRIESLLAEPVERRCEAGTGEGTGAEAEA